MLAKIEINYPKTSLGLSKDRQHLSEEWIFPKAKYVSWIRGQQGCGLRKVLVFKSLGVEPTIQCVFLAYFDPKYHSGRFIQANPPKSKTFSYIFPSFVYLLLTKPIAKWSRAPG